MARHPVETLADMRGISTAAIFVPSKTAVGRVLTNYGQTSVVIYFMCDANEGPKERFFDATEVDEGRPLDVGRQRLASNQAVRLGFKRPWS